MAYYYIFAKHVCILFLKLYQIIYGKHLISVVNNSVYRLLFITAIHVPWQVMDL